MTFKQDVMNTSSGEKDTLCSPHISDANITVGEQPVVRSTLRKWSRIMNS